MERHVFDLLLGNAQGRNLFLPVQGDKDSTALRSWNCFSYFRMCASGNTADIPPSRRSKTATAYIVFELDIFAGGRNANSEKLWNSQRQFILVGPGTPCLHGGTPTVKKVAGCSGKVGEVPSCSQNSRLIQVWCSGS